MRGYNEKYALKNIRKVLTSSPINWFPMVNLMMMTSSNMKKNDWRVGKMSHKDMPKLIDCGIGGIHGLQFVQNYGPTYFEMDKYYWKNIGEDEEYVRRHELLRTRFANRPEGHEDVSGDPFLVASLGHDPNLKPRNIYK